MSSVALQFTPVAAGYWGLFLIAALACFLAIGRARTLDAPHVRYGLVGLLATTAVWALLKVIYFLAPAPVQRPAYTLGLVFGFATIWVWVYFCSAYTGRSFHLDSTLRYGSAVIFLAVVSVKLTNPIHGLYFSAEATTTPFQYLAIDHGLFHWSVMGFSYVVAGIGLFMLFDLYARSGYDTRPLGVLTVLIGLPVVFDIVALQTTQLIDIIYAPLGVAVFALGVLYVYERRFLAIQSAGDDDDAVIFLDGDGKIRDYTPAAGDMFPELAGATGADLETLLPRVGEMTDRETQVLDYQINGEQRYLLTTTSTVTLGDSEGTVLMLSDVTRAEQRRRELARHNQQLEGFASALAHELRNKLQIIEWRLGIAEERTESGTVEHESIGKADSANDRLTDLVDDFTTLAEYGQTVERLERVEFATAVEDAWWNAETGEMELETTGDGTIEADPGRLRELLGNLFVFARLNGAETVAVSLLEDGFAVTGDGDPPGEEIEGYFTFGESIPSAEAGMKLPNAKTFARVHGWSIGIDTDYQQGVRIVVSGTVTDAAPESTTQAA